MAKFCRVGQKVMESSGTNYRFSGNGFKHRLRRGMIYGVKDGVPAESKNRSNFNKLFKNELIFHNYDDQWYGGYYVQFDDRAYPVCFTIPPKSKIKIKVKNVHLELFCAPIEWYTTE